MEEASSPTASQKADELPKESNERSLPADVVTQRHALLRHISSPVVRRLFIVVRVVLVVGTYIFLWYQFLACNWCDIVCVTTQEDDNVSTSTGCAATGCPSGVDDPSVALPTGWCPLFNGFLLSGVCYGGIIYMLVHWTLLGIWSGCSGYVREYHLAFTDEVLGYSEFEEMKEDIQRKGASARSSTRASGAAAEDSGEETSHLHSLARLSDFEWLRALFVFGFYIWFWVTQWGCNVPEGEYNFMTGSGGLHDGLPLSYCTLVSKMLFEDIGKAQVAYVLLAWLFKLLYACVNRRVKHAIFERGGFLDDFVGYSANAEADEQALHEIEVSVAQAAGADVACEAVGPASSATREANLCARIDASDNKWFDVFRCGCVVLFPAWTYFSVVSCTLQDAGAMSGVLPEVYCVVWMDVILEGICKTGVAFCLSSFVINLIYSFHSPVALCAYLRLEAVSLMGIRSTAAFIARAKAQAGGTLHDLRRAVARHQTKITALEAQVAAMAEAQAASAMPASGQ